MLPSPSLFHEEQQFRQRWLWLLFALVSIPLVLLLGFSVYQQLILGRPVGDHPASNSVLVLIFLSVLVLHSAVIALFWYARLSVTVTESELRYRFFPFHLTPRRIPLQDISDARKRHYSALGEYGGWGIRLGLSGWAYNVSGEDGVQLQLKDGKRILIGSQRSDELEAVLRAR
ncbi:MAG TPA: hypothetical protein VEK57_26460 [Thermoanaerobaculia bacterium]|nr:hypothetical protein [Thermoanaerobaculia bacterium]